MVGFDVTPPPSIDDLAALSRPRQSGCSPAAQAHRKLIIPLDKLPVEMDIDDCLTHGKEGVVENKVLVKKREASIAPKKAASNQDEMWGFFGRLKVGLYFLLWYALNVIYNIMNKKVLNVIPAPVTVGSLQLSAGAIFAASLWSLGLRPTPRLTTKGKKIVQKIGIFHAVGQILTVTSLASGTVSFTHIVKATEPFFSALVAALVFHKWMKLQVYITLLPVVGGVSYACFKGLDFSLLALFTALGSNLAFALRAVFSKSAMEGYIGDNISSMNLFGVVTVESFMISVPIALLAEGVSFLNLWPKAIAVGGTTPLELAANIVLSGLFHYLNNEVMYLALKSVHPVTLAVANTMKRVFILIASVVFFHDAISIQAALGSTVGIVGVLLYCLTKQHYEHTEAPRVNTPSHDKE